MSGAQRLPNGNTLICEGMKGIIFEVTPKKEVVWNYRFKEAARSSPGGSGRSPGWSRGPLPPPEIVATLVRDMLKVSPEQNRGLVRLENDVGARLDNTLSDEQKQRLRERNGTGSRGIWGTTLPGQIMSTSTRISLKPTTQQKKALTEIQKEVDVRLDKILTPDQKVRFNKLKDGSWLGSPPELGPSGHAGFEAEGPPGVGDFPAPPGMNPIFRALRYGADYPGLAGKDLTPGKSMIDARQQALDSRVE
jgi:hypothetical protein